MQLNAKSVSVTLVLVLVAVLAYAVMTTPEHRTPGEKIGAAVDQLDNGVDNAARELKDRTPAERLKDDIKDATNSK